ncbi:toprim domain-containing protein [Amycolatopsis anabasis]|uniref:toprim domain-containing protein n=1 Tax=Amycolatopsis anabasis TaxID=1840409 RepID=UPI00131CA07E|nr:toprim domain-containing protein [Amycolatopsis anabasis]
MARLSSARKRFLVEATSRYHESLSVSPGVEYLATRGLTAESVRKEVGRFRLGYVADPLPGHEMYRGMLAIPYLRVAPDGEWSVVSLRFRCIREGCEHPNHGKYMSMPGDKPRLYNTLELVRNDDTIAICEGEIDAITATICGVPAIGVAGVESWQPHFREPLLGYETVFILADGDEPGMRFATSVAKELANAKIIPMPEKEDVNSTVLARGKTALLERIK